MCGDGSRLIIQSRVYVICSVTFSHLKELFFESIINQICIMHTWLCCALSFAIFGSFCGAVGIFFCINAKDTLNMINLNYPQNSNYFWLLTIDYYCLLLSIVYCLICYREQVISPLRAAYAIDPIILHWHWISSCWIYSLFARTVTTQSL